MVHKFYGSDAILVLDDYIKCVAKGCIYVYKNMIDKAKIHGDNLW